ncbi:MAG: DUF1156 domain-containing protein [Deltaproteobacteria bacterium]|nr:DUF1156 domain-containing protein [Deltaproteobacteria bacterium]
MTYRKKLIEVALPLEAINAESAKRKRKAPAGYPTTLHKWWAQRPLAACRAVLFASLVDDPSSLPDKFPTKDKQAKERKRLFKIIEDLVLWENSNDEKVLDAARKEIVRSTNNNPPPIYDPFCGGGSIPLEAQRLGLEAHASDLNPVAVLITKALIEIPPKFAGKSPVHPADKKQKEMMQRDWKGAQGLADDVRYYGQWMRDQAFERIGHLYPKVKLPKDRGGGEATVIAWLWARTIKCPNPACGSTMPLVRSFALSTNKGKEAWVKPVVSKKNKTVRFEIGSGEGKAPEGAVNRRGARCIVCDSAVPFDHVRSEGKAGRMGAQLMTIVADGNRGRIYLPPNDRHNDIAESAQPKWRPESELPKNPRDFKTPNYGMKTFAELFTSRQLVALTTFSDLVGSAHEKVLGDAIKAGMEDDKTPLDDGGAGARAYADAVATYLAFAVSRNADYGNSLASWRAKDSAMRSAFAKQALPMVWDFAEGNPFGSSSSGFPECVHVISSCLPLMPLDCPIGSVLQLDATSLVDEHGCGHFSFSTDPPYYDNIGYADLSDFFYIWLRRSVGKCFPNIFSTMLVPKRQELIASPYRFDGDHQKAKDHFEKGFVDCFTRMSALQSGEYPICVFYAFKQSESDEGDEDVGTDAIASTGWETMLAGLVQSKLIVLGTWPMRTEGDNRSIGIGTNALASSIVLVCRPRPDDAPMATRKEFIAALKKELPDALTKLQAENIAPVDLAQASIGPGMGVFSRYSKVLEADGNPMSVRTALQTINTELDTYLATQEGDLDKDTRFCVSWFEQYGMVEAQFGEADVLARAKNTSVDGLVEAGVLKAKAGKVRLLKRDEMLKGWDPATDKRLTVWECTQYLIGALDEKGEEGAARLVKKLGAGRSDDAKSLAYRLYAICDRKGWSDEAQAYNRLVISWESIVRAAAGGAARGEQLSLGT